jgi:hypothetical protein
MRASAVCLLVFTLFRADFAFSDALNKVECLLLFQNSNYKTLTRHYSLLKRLRTSEEVDPFVRELIGAKEYSRAVSALKRLGQEADAKALRTFIEVTLQDSEIVSIESTAQGVSQSQILTFVGGVKAIFKPYVPHWVDRYYAWAANSHAEVLAYEFAKLLNLRVPVTIERTIGGVRGSLQVWYETQSPIQAPVSLLEWDTSEYRRMRAFDFLVNNTDRHVKNYIRFDSGHILIDHGLSFIPERRGGHGPYLWEVFDDHPFDEGFYSALRTKLTEPVIDLLLDGKVSEEVIQTVKKRRKKLLRYHQDRTRALSSSGASAK